MKLGLQSIMMLTQLMDLDIYGAYQEPARSLDTGPSSRLHVVSRAVITDYVCYHFI